MTQLKRIAIVGPECTGKSSLAKALAQVCKTNWVPEYAREFLDALDRPYQQADLLLIAQGQLALEDTIATQTKSLLVCDTNLVVIKIWSEFKYGDCDPAILTLLKDRKYDAYLLTNIDIPWEDDPLREHPEQRGQLMSLYRDTLKSLDLVYTELSGTPEIRLQKALSVIEQL